MCSSVSMHGVKKLTQCRLKQLLNYDPVTGLFYHNRERKKKLAGYDDGRGYLLTIVDGGRYYNHRLAWLYVYGYLPENVIDHINRNPSDNRIANLREVSHSCNAQNVPLRSNNTSGITGVHWNKAKGKWEAYITNNGKRKGLGFASDFVTAVFMRYLAERKYRWSVCSGETESYKYLVAIGLLSINPHSYSQHIWESWVYNSKDTSPKDSGYAECGLMEEIGELAGKFKRISRGEKVYSTDILYEAGDILWNISQLCVIKSLDLGIFATVAAEVKQNPPVGINSIGMLTNIFTHTSAFLDNYTVEALRSLLLSLLSGVRYFSGGELQDILFLNKVKTDSRYNVNKITGKGDHR